MIDYKTFIPTLFLLIGCAKGGQPPHGVTSVSFIYSDNKRTSSVMTTLGGARFSAQRGGNDIVDTSQGFVFQVNGGNNSSLNFTFEIPKLQSGSYSYKAFSAAWPRPLTLDQWEYSDGTFLEPDSINIIIDISRNSNNTADGTFSAVFNDGTFYANITSGSFKNVPEE